MTDTIFFRLLDGVNRPSRLSDAIEELREGGRDIRHLLSRAGVPSPGA